MGFLLLFLAQGFPTFGGIDSVLTEPTPGCRILIYFNLSYFEKHRAFRKPLGIY